METLKLASSKSQKKKVSTWFHDLEGTYKYTLYGISAKNNRYLYEFLRDLCVTRFLAITGASDQVQHHIPPPEAYHT